MFIESPCIFPFVQIVVKSNGSLYFCSDQHLCIGNLFDNNFDDIWFSESADEVRLSLTREVLYANCDSKSCPLYSKKLYGKKFEYGEYPAVLIIDADLPDDLLLKLAHLSSSLAKLILVGDASESFNNLISIFSNPDLHVTIETSGILNVQDWLAVQNSIIKFHIDYVKSPLKDFYEFSRVRNKATQKLFLKNTVKNLNTYESLGIIHLAREAKADGVEFTRCVDLEANQDNCGLLFNLEQSILEESKKLGVECFFKAPLDDGLFNNLVIL